MHCWPCRQLCLAKMSHVSSFTCPFARKHDCKRTHESQWTYLCIWAGCGMRSMLHVQHLLFIALPRCQTYQLARIASSIGFFEQRCKKHGASGAWCPNKKQYCTDMPTLHAVDCQATLEAIRTRKQSTIDLSCISFKFRVRCLLLAAHCLVSTTRVVDCCSAL